VLLQQSPSLREHLIRGSEKDNDSSPLPPKLFREASTTSVQSYGSVDVDQLGQRFQMSVSDDLQQIDRIESNSNVSESAAVQDREDEGTSSCCQHLLWLSIAAMMGISMNFCSITSSYFLKDMGGTPAQVTAALATVSLPWSIKPLWGFLVDNVRGTLGFHGYALLGTVATAVGWLLTSSTHDVDAFIHSNLVAQAGLSLLSVVGETMMVVACAGLPHGVANALQARFWMANTAGTLVGSLSGGTLNVSLAPEQMYLLNTALSLLLLPIIALSWGGFCVDGSCLNRESEQGIKGISFVSGPRATRRSMLMSPSRASQVRLLEEDPTVSSDAATDADDVDSGEEPLSLWEFVTGMIEAYADERRWKPLLFAFIFQVTPSMSPQVCFFYYVNELHISKSGINVITNVGYMIGLVGLFLYGKYGVNFSIRKVVMLGIFTQQAVCSLSILLFSGLSEKIGIPSEPFIMVDQSLVGMIGQITTLPLFGLAALLSPPGMEATIFCTFISVYNFGGTLGNEISSYMTLYFGITSDNYENMTMYCIACRVLNLVPLLFLWLLPSDDEVQDQHEKRQKIIIRQSDFSKTWDHFEFSFFASPVSSEEGSAVNEPTVTVGAVGLKRASSTPNLPGQVGDLLSIEESWLTALTDSVTLTNSAIGPMSASFSGARR